MSPQRDYYLPSRQLVSQQDAALIQRPDVPRAKFINRWTRKTTFDAGLLIPFLVDEILPGDHMRYNVTALVRMSTPLFPIFDEQRVDTFFFFVPCRLLWTNWVKMMGEQNSPSDSIAYTVPVMTGTVGGEAVGSLADHLGLPVAGQISAPNSISPNVLPFRAYELIYNNWFKDQNAIAANTPQTGDGPDAAALYTLRRRAKSHDYFTSCLPWPNKFTAPTISLGSTAPIAGIGVAQADAAAAGPIAVKETAGGSINYSAAFDDATNTIYIEANTTGGGAVPQIYADLSLATGITINALRQAVMVTALTERDARGGTRYVELLKSHFGVTNPDYRLMRPEYIGGGQTPLSITPIAQTAPTAGVPLGAIGGAGTAAGNHSASYAATEHGYIIGLVNIKSELSYSQGVHKLWRRSTRYDFYWPALALLGEQAVTNDEIWSNGDATVNFNTVFGYQERWAEYRQRYSEVTGLFRPTSTGAIDQWHLSQEFTAAPTLGQTFINDTPPMDRVLAAGSADAGKQYLATFLIHREAVRPLPVFGTPATLGRF